MEEREREKEERVRGRWGRETGERDGEETEEESEREGDAASEWRARTIKKNRERARLLLGGWLEGARERVCVIPLGL